MSDIGPTRPPSGPPPGVPSQPTGPSPSESASQSAYDAELLQSPFAKMFTATGAQPTAKEIQAIINGILKQQVDDIKKQDEEWKKAMKKMKDIIEGND